MQCVLLVNDDLQKTFKRASRVKKGSKPGDFVPGESLENSILTPTHIYGQKEDTPESQAND